MQRLGPRNPDSLTFLVDQTWSSRGPERGLGLSNSVEVADRVGWPEGGGNYYKL